MSYKQEQEIEKLLNPLPHKMKVMFALYCAKDVMHLMKKEGINCIDLAEKWLNDETSVSKTELINAADVAAHATYAIYTAYATYVAANAAFAAAHATTPAVDAVAAAAANAANATYIANAAYADPTEKLKQYHDHLITMINRLTPLEKLIYKIDA